MDRLLIWYLFFAILILTFGFALIELFVCPATKQLTTVIDVPFC